MGFGSQTATGQFLSALAQGFVQTRVEVVLFFAFIIVVALLVTIYSVVQKHAATRRLSEHSQEMFEHLLFKLDLNEQETTLLGHLARYRNKDEPVNTLLMSHHIFDACARIMSRHEPGSEAHVNALRLKIGFRAALLGDVPASSLALPEGSPVILVSSTKVQVHASILVQSPDSILLQLHQGSPLLAEGSHVTVFFHNSSGIFSFPSRIRNISGDTVHVDHCSTITRQQRRSYYRRRESLPVWVKLVSAGSSSFESHLLDLGGGGASLQNPGGLLKKGDLFEMSFSPLMGKFTLVARVVRTARVGKAASVTFVSMSEAERNRVMGFLFAQSEKRQIPHL